ncbi:MAG: YwqG family protein [Vallitalea sp.]|jgi:uncharacterized protein YwqG|nr:YwqG family protein [Vallitalea sp.]
MKYTLPEELIKFKDIINSSMKPVIKIKGEEASTLLWDSKIGGNPYWELYNKDYPNDSNGKPMRLLAQINFTQMPHMEFFPTDGLLQFFISADDDIYGFNDKDFTCQQNYRVVYHGCVNEDIDKLITDFSFVAIDEWFPAPIEAKMLFQLDEEAVSIEDFQFEKYFCESGRYIIDDEELDLYRDIIPGWDHKVGGYAYFTQDDPRKKADKEYDIVLLQLDTDDSIDMMWGDAGVANFFIRKEELLKLDFTKVYYTWDCC